MKHFFRVCTLTAVCLGTVAAADVITMKNGDRLTGTIIKADGKTIVLKSEYAGQVTLPWEAVAGITAATPVYVGLKDGNVLMGALSLLGEKVEVASKETGTVPANRSVITYIRSSDEQAAWQQEIDRYRNPRLVDLWTGFLDIGISQARGNASTSNLATSASAIRATTRDKIAVGFTSLYATATTPEQVSVTTANAVRGGVKYELNLTPRIFTFASADLEYDEFQKLDLRFAPAWGLGHHVWKADRGFFDWQAGASLNREFFSTGLKRTSGEVLLGQEFLYRLTQRMNFREKMLLFPNVSDRGDYRVNLDLSADAALWRWFGWHITLSDRLLSAPVPGRKKNDVLLTTGFRLTFAK